MPKARPAAPSAAPVNACLSMRKKLESRGIQERAAQLQRPPEQSGCCMPENSSFAGAEPPIAAGRAESQTSAAPVHAQIHINCRASRARLWAGRVRNTRLMLKCAVTHAFGSTNTHSMRESTVDTHNRHVGRTSSRQPTFQIARIRRYALEKPMKPLTR